MATTKREIHRDRMFQFLESWRVFLAVQALGDQGVPEKVAAQEILLACAVAEKIDNVKPEKAPSVEEMMKILESVVSHKHGFATQGEMILFVQKCRSMAKSGADFSTSPKNATADFAAFYKYQEQERQGKILKEKNAALLELLGRAAR